MIGKLLWLVLVKMQQPDPPHIAKAKHVIGETKAFAELSNEVLPLVLDQDPVAKGDK